MQKTDVIQLILPYANTIINVGITCLGAYFFIAGSNKDKEFLKRLKEYDKSKIQLVEMLKKNKIIIKEKELKIVNYAKKIQ